jgi:hypothetical protein
MLSVRQRLGITLLAGPKALTASIYDMKRVEERFGILKCLATKSAFRNRGGASTIFV